MPGLKVVQPSTPHDAKGLLLAALADPNPVMIFEHKLLYKMKGEVPEGYYAVPIGKATVRRKGRDVTIVGSGIMVHKALEAAGALAKDAIDAEVIDLRSIRPIDRETILAGDRKADLCLRRRQNPQHRRGNQRHDGRERYVRLTRRADCPAWRHRVVNSVQPAI